jgi:hypothetical protein
VHGDDDLAVAVGGSRETVFTALSSSPLRIITSGVAISAGSTPNVPSRRIRTWAWRGHLGGRGRDSGFHDPVELDRLVGGERQSLVHQRWTPLAYRLL